MPGIVAIISKMPRKTAVEQLERMVATTRHESFYTSGVLADEASGVYVGWTARRGSFSDGMPLRNESADHALVFSGEEFPEPGTIQRLKARGHRFNEQGPAYLVHASEDDQNFPSGLNGRFHGLALDRNTKTALVFNDRFGMHRLYYHESKNACYFAAEAKAILAVCPELRTLDPQSLGEFVACGAVLENRTLFDGIRVLPAGSAWTFQDGRLERRSCYFHPNEWERQEKLDKDSYYRELREVFTRNLPRYFDGPEQIAMSLTGGLDTRMILAGRTPEPDSLPCYTFGSMFRDNHDVRVARRVAGVVKQPHHVITAGQEFLANFGRYAERSIYLTDGCIDVSRSPDLYLNEKAREVAPVRMTGNYGGEILRGVRGFKPEEPAAGLFRPDFLSYIHQAKSTYAGVLGDDKISFAAFKQAPWYHHGVLSLEQTQLSMRSPFLDNDFVRTVFKAPVSTLASNEISLRLIADGNRDLVRIPTDRGFGGDRGEVWKQASHALLEFQFKAEYAYDMGMPQWLAKFDNTFKPLHLERMFLGRHKPFHFRIWYRDNLAGYLKETLLDPQALSRPYLDRKGAEAVVLGHIRGNRNHTNELHKLLTLELLHRLLLDNSEGGGKRGRSELHFTIA